MKRSTKIKTFNVSVHHVVNKSSYFLNNGKNVEIFAFVSYFVFSSLSKVVFRVSRVAQLTKISIKNKLIYCRTHLRTLRKHFLCMSVCKHYLKLYSSPVTEHENIKTIF